MKILIIRHADPDYSIDSITETGKIEAELLSQSLIKLDIADFYVSPLGRARDTANYTLKKLGREAEVCDWLREFPYRIQRPDRENSVVWDWKPIDWTGRKNFYSLDDWYKEPEMDDGGVYNVYKNVCEGFDALLAKHGYERCENYYKVTRANEDTIVFFCHFGLECVLLSHLLGISPMLLWHGFCAAPTSVTTVITEERDRGIAYFRVNSFANTSHLYVAGREPSFAARFCETYDNANQRHD